METNDNETCCRKFGARIAKLRSGKGKTQEAFAEECGISKSELRKLEEGATHISLDTLLVLARHLGLIVFLSLIAAFYKASIHEIIAFKNEAICKEILHALVLFVAGDLVTFLENEQQDNDHHCHNK